MTNVDNTDNPNSSGSAQKRADTAIDDDDANPNREARVAERQAAAELRRAELAKAKEERIALKAAKADAKAQKEVAKALKFKVPPTAQPAQVKRRHWGVLLYFCAFVLLPTALSGWYLYNRAADQYPSTIGFSVRAEENGAAIEILGGLTDLSSSSGKDTDILFEFIQSQQLVQQIDAKLDLHEIYTKVENDPIFSLKPDSPIEDLVDYWHRMVKVFYDGGTGLIEIRVLAFDPQDAQNIGRAIFEESSKLINELSAISRDDATRYAREELDRAVERLKQAREAITAFRLRTQIVDPNADVQTQMGLLGTLQTQLAEALIELELLRETTRDGDPRVAQAVRRIGVIRNQIELERRKFGVGGQGPGGEDYASVFAEYERLTVDREFAEQAYTVSLSNYDAALSEAQRKSRYLAAYIQPTLAETSKYPQRLILLGLVGLFLTMIWAIMVLIYYSVRDRR